MFKRIFIIVADSFGIGELPDAERFGDCGSNTLRSVYSSDKFNAPVLSEMGLFNIDGIDFGTKASVPTAAFGRAAEMSNGKDTVTGHWEIAGIYSENAMPTYPNGFPDDLLEKIETETGIGTLCNKPYSGTDVIRDYGREQLETGKMIVYTSADSVFQAAAHEDLFPVEKLYEYCEKARKILCGEHAVGRVIARPYVGEYPNYTRTSGRHDFALEPTADTVLDLLKSGGYETICVGKINDIFASRGVSETHPTTSNAYGMQITSEIAARDFTGLCFVNLVDFDSSFGHRNDVDGYAKAISEFDSWLGGFTRILNDDDLLIVTADHGCDPATPSTDHSREYIPILAYGKKVTPCNLGTLPTYSCIGKTVADNFGIKDSFFGKSFLDMLNGYSREALCREALEAMKLSYAPFSHWNVGAALLGKSGKIYRGCNIESATFTATSCAERTALTKAVSEGEKEFVAVAVTGGASFSSDGLCYPCGVCRQFLREMCGTELEVIVTDKDLNMKIHKLLELLPFSFTL